MRNFEKITAKLPNKNEQSVRLSDLGMVAKASPVLGAVYWDGSYLIFQKGFLRRARHCQGGRDLAGSQWGHRPNRSLELSLQASVAGQGTIH